MNRNERRALDKQVKKSINVIKDHLAFLNQAGNPKYKLVVKRSLGDLIRAVFGR